MENYQQRIVQLENFIWIDIENPDQIHLDKIAEEYELDYFQIKDSLERGHLPKFEKMPDYNFLILRAFVSSIDKGATSINELSNKMAFFYDKSKLITIHRSAFDFVRQAGTAYSNTEEMLAYFILKMLQSYETPLKDLEKQIEHIEKVIFLHDYSKVSLEDLYFLKAQTRVLKKLLQIFQNVVQQIEVSEDSKTAYQDIKDKLLSLLLNYDEVLEDANNLLNTYLSVNAQKSNDVMKLLTIFSAFFLPLTFIAGIYGMNFDNMPELKWENGYFGTLGMMLLIALFIYMWFKRKRIL